MRVSIRKLEERDLRKKVEWVNNPANNRYLHYDLPLDYEKTVEWFHRIENDCGRYDAVIEVDGVPIGLIGLLDIDGKVQKAEYYVMLGEPGYGHRGIASAATEKLLEYAFGELRLNKVYLYTETENVRAQRMFERAGFVREGYLENDAVRDGQSIDRYVYGMTRRRYYSQGATMIQLLGEYCGNRLYVKREDLIPYSFGGNKARKCRYFFDEIDAGNYDYVVSYGSSSSNHCRVVANMAAQRGMRCTIVSPSTDGDTSYNEMLVAQFGAQVIHVPVEKVSETIEHVMQSLREDGFKPYFIPGGGHGDLGTRSYIDCYEEIRAFEQECGRHFSKIFLASGTGTTQAGLVCGKLLNGDERSIVGISIARMNPRGRNIVINSVQSYLGHINVDAPDELVQGAVCFVDDYVAGGYGAENEDVRRTIDCAMKRWGLPLDETYTGKAFTGMSTYLAANSVQGEDVLFIHTGGTPLFFDYLEKSKDLN